MIVQVKMDPDIIACVKNRNKPRNVKELQQF